MLFRSACLKASEMHLDMHLKSPHPGGPGDFMVPSGTKDTWCPRLMQENEETFQTAGFSQNPAVCPGGGLWHRLLSQRCTFGPKLASELKLWCPFGSSLGSELKLLCTFGLSLVMEPHRRHLFFLLWTATFRETCRGDIVGQKATEH